MKEFKGFIFYFTIVFIIVCSFLIISIHKNTEKAMNKTLIFETDTEFKQFISNSRLTLGFYKLKARTTGRIECLNEVEKAIDYIDKMQNQGDKTYKELYIKYYADIWSPREIESLNYSNIVDKCGISIKEDKTKLPIVRAALMYTTLLQIDAQKYFDSNTDKFYSYSVVKKIFDLIAVPDYETLLKKSKYDIPSQMELLGKDYITGILELVGDNNEE